MMTVTVTVTAQCAYHSQVIHLRKSPFNTTKKTQRQKKLPKINKPTTTKSVIMSRTTTTFVLAVVVAAIAVMSSGGTIQQYQVDAFATPRPSVVWSQQRVVAGSPLKMGFFNDEERKPLTRDSEPEEFFATYVFFFSSKDSIIYIHGRTTFVSWLIVFLGPANFCRLRCCLFIDDLATRMLVCSFCFAAAVQYTVPLLLFVFSCWSVSLTICFILFLIFVFFFDRIVPKLISEQKIKHHLPIHFNSNFFPWVLFRSYFCLGDTATPTRCQTKKRSQSLSLVSSEYLLHSFLDWSHCTLLGTKSFSISNKHIIWLSKRYHCVVTRCILHNYLPLQRDIL